MDTKMKNGSVFIFFIVLLPSGTFSEKCSQSGSCSDGFLLDIVANVSQTKCRDECLMFSGFNAPCYFYTHCDDNCYLYKDCDNVNEDNPTCFWGKSDCEFCGVSGICQGMWISVFEEYTLYNCWNDCQQDQRCQWYMFDKAVNKCFLYDNCDNFSALDCDECVVNQEFCPASYQRLMVVGGVPTPFEVEVVDLSGNGHHCTNKSNGLSDFFGVGTFINGEAIVCNSNDDNDPTGDCYVYNDSNDSWSIGPNTNMSVFWSASVIINDGQNWWISGGDPNTRQSVLYDGTSFSPFVDIRYGRDYGHQMLSVNNTHVVVLEGRSAGEAEIFDLTKSVWSPFPTLPHDKDWYFAGFATYADGTRHIIAGGGFFTMDNGTWIFDLDSGSDVWRRGSNDLYLEYARTVQFGDTFLVIGGENTETLTFSNQIWEFDPLSEGFVLRPETLKSAKEDVATFLIPDDYALC